MAIGITARNVSGVMNISDSFKSYVYLAKYGPYNLWQLDSNQGTYVDVQCVGYPMVYISLPYETQGAPADYPAGRSGYSVRSITQVNSTTWRVVLNGNDARTYGGSGAYLSIELRVFGRLDLNHPGKSDSIGLFVRDAAGSLVFDSGRRMLRLAGNSYDIDLALPWQAPFSRAEFESASAVASYDSNVTLPFNLAGKSICAGGRGQIWTGWPNGTTYYDEGAGYWIFQYDLPRWCTGYWATGTQLQARRILTFMDTYDSFGSYTLWDTSNCATVYTRISIIDNSQFP